MVAYTRPPHRKKEESGRLRGKRGLISIIVIFMIILIKECNQ